MQRIGFLVEVVVPDNADIQDVMNDIKTSVGFGQPVVTFRSLIKNHKVNRSKHKEEKRPVQDVSLPD